MTHVSASAASTSESTAVSAGAEPDDRSAVYDHHTMMKNTGHDPTFVRALIEMFQAESERQLDAVRQAVAARDAKRIQATAHILKGSVALFGAKACIEAAAKLEEMAERGCGRDLDPQCQAVCELVAGLCEALKDY
ncbi:MAG: Hpt domain-containing protein [Novipirellula sp. JB048]